MATQKTILVTGDYGLDYNIYLPTDLDTPPPDSPPTQLSAMLGGAGIIHRLLMEIARLKKVAKEPMEIGVAFGCVPNAAASADSPDWEKHRLAPPTAAVWHKRKLGNLGRDKDDQEVEVWRVNRSLSLGQIADQQSLPALLKNFPPAMETNISPEIIVVEDNAAGIRFTVPEWLKAQPDGQSNQAAAAKWILLKMTAPVCHGDLWWTLTANGTLADKLIVVVSVNDLRQEDIRVSQGISWERTAQDLARELTHNPALAELCKARHVIVTLHGEGALWMERPEKTGMPSFHLIFDPEHMEEEWAVKTRCDGNAYGFHSCFVTAMAADLMLVKREADQIKTGIKHGLWVMRWLRGLGHGLVKGAAAGLPANDLAALILADSPKAYADDLCASKDKRTPAQRLDYKQLGEFGLVTIPEAAVGDHVVTLKDAQIVRPWRIMVTGEDRTPSQSIDSARSPEPLYGLARRVALLGLKGLENVPVARFGKLITADRDEIEALRNIKRLIHGYCQRTEDTKPLSIAVFGPPGAGKSFGIKEIAKEMFQEKTSFLDFNLSQFNGAADLIGAFHQVRDRVLEGFVPVVFWDEFDSTAYKWLQFLLAPMQDGKFQEGQVTHPIGRCIFVFAGATSYDFEHFGPSEKYPKDDKEAKEAYTSFKLAKGPDFKSRLHATLNVLGPNPRSLFCSDNPPDKQWQDDPTDVCFPVRRAMLLRALLGFAGKRERARMEMDHGLLAALLETPHYTFGARSLEKIVLGLKENEKHGLHRSALPSNEVLALNVQDLVGFKAIMDRSRQFQEYVEDLAPAIHKAWLPLADRNNPNLTDFEKLTEETKADNRAAALRIPLLLELAGLFLVRSPNDPSAISGEVKFILEKHEELLAEEEHNHWMAYKLASGWKKAPHPKDKAEERQQRSQRLHFCLVPYDKLDDANKERDRNSVRKFPEMAQLAKFMIVSHNPNSKR